MTLQISSTMSFDKNKKYIEEGDTVMLYLGRQSLMTIKVDSSKTHQTKFGAFSHKELIGKSFGAKAYSKNKKGWIWLLHPTPELWTVTLPHRTQVLYSTDISLITLLLELKPGSVVVESGTGSGSLSHAIVRCIKPNGHLYTFDFHQQRVEKAREEFKDHGFSGYVSCACADACKDGFGMEDGADAVFLDLPAPWDAVPHAKRALKKSGGRICSFSPCIEQVQRTCDVLQQHRFCEIKVMECLLRTINVQMVSYPEANLGSKELTTKMSAMEPITSSAEKRVKVNVLEKWTDMETDVTLAADQVRKDKRRIVGLDNTSKSMNASALTLKNSKEMPGHTGYLTFASTYPRWLKQREKNY
ncbi:tRNA (adenine(58)-N(1))-methyltransferase catalytic subunit TRMT61A-like isoform X2 [Hydractinia symbiolongicarpus]|uniref:tRNA (adenine(58)-N(1))-methyltransferase catalytic subunit TRMT61A-like isoform X2 n=1 Tax=Hydractinia symbiolongicarpus TaxID=13093 RepID=UPI0025511267|nr:tRNA (adenine(58)-N(1))-methyltransferase catalytic subunit TRMT61A-like isoform X2 [Hydractinia symbiolongicarpus]